MRTSNFGKGQRLTGLFRLCLGIIVALSLAMGGMTLNTQPVQAAIEIVGPCPITIHAKPCLPGTYDFDWTGSSWDPPHAERWDFWWSGLNPALTDPNSHAYLDGESGVLSYRFCKDDAGKTFTFEIIVTEYYWYC